MSDQPSPSPATWGILLLAAVLGAWLRWIYVDGTPVDLRAHDVQGHLDYLSFLLEYGHMPSHSQGFQGYQPPLYYVLAVLSTGQEAGEVLDTAALQQLSMWISWITLGLGLWIGRMLFGGTELALFCAALATFPGLIYSASRVSNDGLVQLLMFAALWLLIRWRQTAQDRWWLGCAAVIGLSVLTKSSGLLLLPVAAALLWLGPSGRRLKLGATAGGIIAAISGWLIAVRLWVDQTPSIVPNTSALPPELHLDTSLLDLVGFNPVRLLQHPFGNRLEWLQQEQGLWEYYFRSAFFGEFFVPPSLTHEGWLILLLGLLLLPVLGLGIYRSLYSEPDRLAHLWVPLLVLLNIHGLYRVLAPFTPSQDFRYTSLVLLPAVALALHGARGLPKALRWTVWTVMAALTGTCAHFVLVLLSGGA
jgi:4-amino-4-deoxy-L-arabinose transferase-like glycosyltransferase